MDLALLCFWVSYFSITVGVGLIVMPKMVKVFRYRVEEHPFGLLILFFIIAVVLLSWPLLIFKEKKG